MEGFLPLSPPPSLPFSLLFVCLSLAGPEGGKGLLAALPGSWWPGCAAALSLACGRLSLDVGSHVHCMVSRSGPPESSSLILTLTASGLWRSPRQGRLGGLEAFLAACPYFTDESPKGLGPRPGPLPGGRFKQVGMGGARSDHPQHKGHLSGGPCPGGRGGGGRCWTPPGLDRGGCSSLVARTKFFHGNSCLSQDGNLFDLGRTLAGDVPFSPGPVRESGGPDSPPIPAAGAVQGGVCGPPGGALPGGDLRS